MRCSSSGSQKDYRLVSLNRGYMWKKYFEIISVFYLTRKHVWNWNKIILATETGLKLFQNYFSDIEYVVNRFHVLDQTYFRWTLTKADMILK